MRILFVAMQDSVHVARWISQITGRGWEVYLFPVYRADPHPAFQKITIYGTSLTRPSGLDKSVGFVRWSSMYFYWDAITSHFKPNEVSDRFKEEALVRVVQNLRPDIVHSLEFQHAGYLTLGAKKVIGDRFPKWIATNWGSDIYLFARLAEHVEKIKQVMQNCDYYSCECVRDVQLAREMGFQGVILPVLPNAGGLQIDYMNKYRKSGSVSSRKAIVLKGYQGWAGRALVALQALRQCKDLLRDYIVVIYSAMEDVKITAELFSFETGVRVKILPQSSHEDILQIFGEARVYIGLSISDGISTSLPEAMAMGAFPIQSYTACADEWIVDGKSGMIVPPEDPDLVAKAIRRALSDDSLVDHAAEINASVVRERLDWSIIQPQVIKFYQDVVRDR